MRCYFLVHGKRDYVDVAGKGGAEAAADYAVMVMCARYGVRPSALTAVTVRQIPHGA